jgi:hypothetical protein
MSPGAAKVVDDAHSFTDLYAGSFDHYFVKLVPAAVGWSL